MLSSLKIAYLLYQTMKNPEEFVIQLVNDIQKNRGILSEIKWKLVEKFQCDDIIVEVVENNLYARFLNASEDTGEKIAEVLLAIFNKIRILFPPDLEKQAISTLNNLPIEYDPKNRTATIRLQINNPAVLNKLKEVI